jgi:hypothetical protein
VNGIRCRDTDPTCKDGVRRVRWMRTRTASPKYPDEVRESDVAVGQESARVILLVQQHTGGFKRTTRRVIPAILASTWRGRAASTRDPRSRYLTTTLVERPR